LNQDVLDPGAAGSCLLCRPDMASLLIRSRDNLDRMPLESSRVRAIERLARGLRC
jgi:hypothetical protein